jgi:hypothetical protein
MSISERIAAGVAEGVTTSLNQRRMLAEEQIDELDKLQDELHTAAGELASHVAYRPELERKAIPALMEQTDPVTLKPYTKTGAEANLDLVPEFAAWRQRRNELEGQGPLPRREDRGPAPTEDDWVRVQRRREAIQRRQDEEVAAILNAGFLYDELEWKVQTSGVSQHGLWARVVPYVTSRAILERLDEAFGPGGHDVALAPFEVSGKAGFKATITVKWPSGTFTKREDVSDLTDNEPVKGGASGAIKRAAVQYGIGRYLYTSPDFYAVIHENGEFRGHHKDKATGKVEYYRWSLPKEAHEWIASTQRSLAAHREATASVTGPTPTSAEPTTATPLVGPAPSPSSGRSSSPTASPPPSRPAATAAPATHSSTSAPAMPGRDGWFKGWAGKPIADVPVGVLEESRAYYAKRIADNPTDKWINKTKADLAAIEAELLTRDQGGGSADDEFPDFDENPFDHEAPDDLPY